MRNGEIFVRVSPNRLSKVQDMKSQNKIEHNDTESYSKHSEGVAGKIARKVETRVSETVPAPAEVPEENNTNMEGFVVVLLFYVHGKHLRSCRDGQLT